MNAPEPTPRRAPLPSDSSVAGHHFPGAELPIVPDYELIRRIGGGAYGDVWLARSTTGVLRAVKIVWRHTFEDERPFQREFEGIQCFERLSREHPSQLALFHVGRGEGYFFYVMELADDANAASEKVGERESEKEADVWRRSSPPINPETYAPKTLRSLLRPTIQPSTLPPLSPTAARRCRNEVEAGNSQPIPARLPAAQVLEIGLALTEALSHLHTNGLVHRDVKPSNVIFVNGRPKLADIGLVTDTGDTRSIVGTEGYLAPEGPGTPQADIFALGKVLYEAVTARDRRQFPQLPPDLRAWPDGQLIFELNEILLEACAGNARERYIDAEAMRADLAVLQRGKSIRRKLLTEQRLSLAKKFSFVAGLVLLISALPFVNALKNKRASDPEVVRLHQLARLHLDKATKEGKQLALECINRALQLDPNFAPGYSTLLEIYFWGGLVPDQDKKIRECARKLMELDSTLAASHMAVSWVKFMDGDWQGAEKEIRQAIKLNPDYAPASGVYGFYLAVLGRAEESQARFIHAQELDPVSRDLAATAGYSFLTARQYEQAIAQVRKALALDPNWAAAHQFIAQIYEDWGKYPEAIGAFEKSELLSAREPAKVLEKYNVLRQAYADGGAKGYWLKKRDLMEVLAEFVDVKDLPGERSYFLAKLYAHLQDREQALLWLEKARTEDHDMVWLKVEPCWDLVREDPGLIALLKQAGLEK